MKIRFLIIVLCLGNITWGGKVLGAQSHLRHKRPFPQGNHSFSHRHCRSTWVHTCKSNPTYADLRSIVEQDQLNSQANVGRSTALRCIEASSLPSTSARAGVAWVRSGTVRVVCRWGSDRGCGRGYEVPVMSRCIIDVSIISFPDSFRAALKCWDFRTRRWAIRLTELVFGCETTAWLLIFVHV